MAFREVVRSVLKSNGGTLTAEEICKQIEKQNLFTKRDGTFLDKDYLLLRAKYYSDFEFIVRLKN